MTLVAAEALNLLFMQAAEHALERSCAETGGKPDHEAAFYRVEHLGHAVGLRLAARVLLARAGSRRTAGLAAAEPLEIVKFLCRELWGAAFGKGIDGLKTNHRGVYVLQDAAFPWLARFVDCDPKAPETARMSVLVRHSYCSELTHSTLPFPAASSEGPSRRLESLRRSRQRLYPFRSVCSTFAQSTLRNIISSFAVYM